MKDNLYKKIFNLNRIRLKHNPQIMKIQLIILLFFCTGISVNVKAHEGSPEKQEQLQLSSGITGTVVDENGDPIIGASIAEKGTTNGTMTDVDGKFAIQVRQGAVLVISYIGYITQEITIGTQKDFEIKLEVGQQTLDEVVVVGYGTMKKKDLTGAVANVKGDDLAIRKTTQLSTALQGAASGVMVTRDNGEPGATANIRIRGITTIGETAPLVIIDGVPGDINQVNPEDVENMTVLKDAAAASIYGSRAAAGVILITTKRATSTSLKLNYNFSYGWEIPTELPDYVSATRYMEMANEMNYNDNKGGGWYQFYTEDQINNWVKNNLTDPDKYPIENWQKALLKSSASRTTHSVNIAGGGKNIKSKASFRYDKTDGLYVNRSYERFMIRLNNDFEINKYIKANVDVNFKRAKSERPNNGAFGALNTPPIYAIRWTNGMWGDVKDGGNVLAALEDGGKKTTWNNMIGGKAGVDILPFDGLKVSAIIAPNYYFDKYKNFLRQVPYTYADNPNLVKGYVTGFLTTNLEEKRDDSYDVTTQFFANYAKTIGKHDLTAMVGYEDYYAFSETLSASRDQYELENFPYLNVGPETLRDNSGAANEHAYRSFFGRLTYSYENRYLFQANFRRDGSSRFAPKNRWGNFPSFSAGWVLSEESFIKNLNIGWLSFLKFRGSWGRLGNERIPSLYPYQGSLRFGNSLLGSQSDITSVTTAFQEKYAVRDITWETTESWDVGIDTYLFNSRLHLSADFYKKKTKDMLLQLAIPKYMGLFDPDVNAGQMNTKGYDLELGWNDKVNDFSYSISANFSDFISKMGNLNGTEFLGDQIKREGSEFNEWYGFLSDGLFLTQEDLDNSPKLNSNTRVGDVKYRDISGPDGVPDGVISPEYDRVLLGGSLPRYMFGVNFNAAYKGFDLALMFQGVGSRKTRVDAAMVEPLRDNWKNFPSILDGNYWSEKNSDEENARAKYPRITKSGKNDNLRMSDFWMFNGRYLRLKNVTLGYTLPKDILKKAKIEQLRLYVAASDLFCLNNYPKGWDPESGVSGYPITTSLMFGLSIDF